MYVCMIDKHGIEGWLCWLPDVLNAYMSSSTRFIHSIICLLFRSFLLLASFCYCYKLTGIDLHAFSLFPFSKACQMEVSQHGACERNVLGEMPQIAGKATRILTQSY